MADLPSMDIPNPIAKGTHSQVSHRWWICACFWDISPTMIRITNPNREPHQGKWTLFSISHITISSFPSWYLIGFQSDSTYKTYVKIFHDLKEKKMFRFSFLCFVSVYLYFAIAQPSHHRHRCGNGSREPGEDSSHLLAATLHHAWTLMLRHNTRRGEEITQTNTTSARTTPHLLSASQFSSH